MPFSVLDKPIFLLEGYVLADAMQVFFRTQSMVSTGLSAAVHIAGQTLGIQSLVPLDEKSLGESLRSNVYQILERSWEGFDDESIGERLSCLISIGLSTLIARISYNQVPFSIVQGLVCGIHSGVVGALTGSETGKQTSLHEMIAVNSGLSSSDLETEIPDGTSSYLETEIPNDRNRHKILVLADNIALGAFIITQIGMASLKYHPTTTITAASCISTAMRITVIHGMIRFKNEISK